MHYSAEEIPKPVHEIRTDTALAAHLSFQSINIAHAIGVIDLLTEYIQMVNESRRQPSLENQMRKIMLMQNIIQRIHIASLEVSAVASEMDCEEERADQIADYLKNKENAAATRLTVGAIVAGAAGAIAAGALIAKGSAGNAPEIIGIGTGVTEAFLGALILANTRKVEFFHPRNALREIAEGSDASVIFPPSVWYYLNYNNPQATEPLSLREQLMEKWMNLGQLADAKPKKKEQMMNLFFGNGGKYTAEQLARRANMYDQLEAQINLMKQDLKTLAKELENIK
jgi:hypothetical protein